MANAYVTCFEIRCKVYELLPLFILLDTDKGIHRHTQTRTHTRTCNTYNYNTSVTGIFNYSRSTLYSASAFPCLVFPRM